MFSWTFCKDLLVNEQLQPKVLHSSCKYPRERGAGALKQALLWLWQWLTFVWVVQRVLGERGRIQVAQWQVGTGVQAARQRRVAWRCTETQFRMSKPAVHTGKSDWTFATVESCKHSETHKPWSLVNCGCFESHCCTRNECKKLTGWSDTTFYWNAAFL